MNENPHKLHIQRYELFKTQNPEAEFFDVCFEIEGKLLYAHKYMLTTVSDTFKAMLSERWNGTSNEPIQIERYKFHDFSDFIHFLYSDSCNLTADNICVMIDLAEFFNVDVFKSYCEEYALKMTYTLDNIFQLLETAIKYSMDILKKALFQYVVIGFADFINAEKLSSLEKVAFEQLFSYCIDKLTPENLFRFTYQWSEQQAIQKQEESTDESFNLNEAIKHEISPFLPVIPFQSMDMKFLIEYVVERGFIFSYKQLKEILLINYETVKVKFY